MANASKRRTSPPQFPPQEQDRQPGRQAQMQSEPLVIAEDYHALGKLKGKVALITGGDSGIGRSVAVGYAREGADVAIVYLDEHEDANRTHAMVSEAGVNSLLIPGDIGDEGFCRHAVEETVQELGRLDVLVNNAAEQHPRDDIEEISEEQLVRSFRTNIFSMFFLTKAAKPYLTDHEGSTIINTTSVTAYRGSGGLLDYSSTKGAIIAFTRSMSQQLAKNKPLVRVNAVVPGPIWTPLIPSTFDREKVASFGGDTAMGRAGQPAELIGAYVYLASSDSSYMTGQVLHVNGGEIVNS